MAFLFCLFLQDSEAKMFLKHIEHVWPNAQINGDVKLASNPAVKLFSIFRMRLPIIRLSSDHSISSLFLDMLNDLKKCPIQLFETLSNEDKEKFKTESKLNTINQEMEYESQNIEVVYDIRYKDRFVNQVLEFFDSNKIFENLRFHIDLGKFNFLVKEKVVDGIKRKRRLDKNIHTFARIQDVQTDNQSDEFRELVKSPDEVPEDYEKAYIVQTEPHYHIADNKIGLKVIHNKTIFPLIIKNLQALENKIISDAYNSPSNQIPNAFLTVYELPAMLFYEHISGYKGNSALLIKDHVFALKKLYTEIVRGEIQGNQFLSKDEVWNFLKNRNIKTEKIPEVVYEFLLKGTSKLQDKDNWRSILKLMNDESRKSLESLENQISNPQKPGRKGSKALLDGKLATELAADILYLQPKGKHKCDKANSQEYQLLQAKLSKFNYEKKNLVRWFQSLNLIGGSNPHPFLAKINLNNYNGVVSFYRAYLEERTNYLTQLLVNNNKPHFIKKTYGTGIEQIKKFIDETSDLNLGIAIPVEIPQGFFLPFIIEEIKKIDELKNLFTECNGRVNLEYIIRKYFQIVRNDENQSFYQYKRNYEVFDRINDKRNKNLKTLKLERKFYSRSDLLNGYPKILDEIHSLRKKGKNAKKTFGLSEFDEDKLKKMYQIYMSNEAKIREFETHDLLVFFMCEFMLQNITGHNLELGKLQDISPDMESPVLSQKLPIEKPFELKSKAEANRKLAIVHDCKIKDYGILNKILKDRRIPKLLEYLSIDKVEYKAIKNELTAYNLDRIELCKAILEFEKNYIESKGLIDETKKEKYIKMSHSELMNEFSKYIENRENLNLDKLINTRNSYFHNSFPDVKYHESKKILQLNKNEDIKISEKISIEIGKEYEKLSQKIK